jgi:hypothetical protein
MRDEPTFEEVLGGMEDAMGEGDPGGAGERGQPGPYAGAPAGASGTTPAGEPGGEGGSGPLTPAEQVAILDGELKKGTGEFDGMILEEQTNQRRAARERPATAPADAGATSGSSSGSGYGTGEPPGGDTADAGGYSTGGGAGGATRGGGAPPKNTAKYPPPPDIPDGNDDDVVARQLREAAMREPDPKVREKLWDEYRKYKGIEK